MTHKVISKLVVPMVLAIALIVSIGVVYLTDKYRISVDQTEFYHSSASSRDIAETPYPPGRLSRVHLLISTP